MSAMIFIFALMSLILIKPINVKINYILFGIFTAVGVINVYMQPRPVFFATHDHELVGFVGTDGNLEFNKRTASNHYFTFDTWRTLNNEDAKDKNTRRKHDKGVYRYNTKNFNLVYIQKFTSLIKNISQLCNDDSVDFIVSYFDIDSEKCSHKILQGGFIIYKNKDIKYTPTKRRWH